MKVITSSNDFGTMLSAMEACEQSSGVNMLKHGQMVKEAYHTLLDIISGRCEPPAGWRIPTWAFDTRVLQRQLPLDIVDMYLVYHDCGKPVARRVDEDGRVHYPDHARVSEDLWMQLASSVDLDPEQKERHRSIGRLIGMDMDIHTLKTDDIQDFSKRPEAMTLLLAGLAEVHANAPMFGGFDSVSFKIKAKHIEKRGRQVIAALV